MTRVLSQADRICMDMSINHIWIFPSSRTLQIIQNNRTCSILKPRVTTGVATFLQDLQILNSSSSRFPIGYCNIHHLEHTQILGNPRILIVVISTSCLHSGVPKEVQCPVIGSCTAPAVQKRKKRQQRHNFLTARWRQVKTSDFQIHSGHLLHSYGTWTTIYIDYIYFRKK